MTFILTSFWTILHPRVFFVLDCIINNLFCFRHQNNVELSAPSTPHSRPPKVNWDHEQTKFQVASSGFASAARDQHSSHDVSERQFILTKFEWVGEREERNVREQEGMGPITRSICTEWAEAYWNPEQENESRTGLRTTNQTPLDVGVDEGTRDELTTVQVKQLDHVEKTPDGMMQHISKLNSVGRFPHPIFYPFSSLFVEAYSDRL